MDANRTLSTGLSAPGLPPMPVSFIQIVLGACFVLIWVFIGAMIFRDGRYAIQDERESEIFRSHPGHTTPPRPHGKFVGQESRGRNRRGTSAA
jgi:hypothetical protein